LVGLDLSLLLTDCGKRSFPGVTGTSSFLFSSSLIFFAGGESRGRGDRGCSDISGSGPKEASLDGIFLTSFLTFDFGLAFTSLSSDLGISTAFTFFPFFSFSSTFLSFFSFTSVFLSLIAFSSDLLSSFTSSSVLLLRSGKVGLVEILSVGS